jgi:hypothetical protein
MLATLSSDVGLGRTLPHLIITPLYLDIYHIYIYIYIYIYISSSPFLAFLKSTKISLRFEFEICFS